MIGGRPTVARWNNAVHTVALDGDQVLRTRVKVTGRETVAELPVLPGQPKKFTFNDFQGVLAVAK